jgi:predicted nucleic acid-binding protein
MRDSSSEPGFVDTNIWFTPHPRAKLARRQDIWSEWPVVTLDYPATREAAKLSADSQLSFWDSLILVAARRSGAKRIYTEDLQDGQTILGVRVINPFRRGGLE